MSDEGRRWNEDFQKIVQQIALQSDQANARNQLERLMKEADLSFGEWDRTSGRGHEAEMARNAYGLDKYGLEGGYGLRRAEGLDRFGLGKAGLEQSGLQSQLAMILAAMG